MNRLPLRPAGLAAALTLLVGCGEAPEPEPGLTAERERTDVDNAITETYATFSRAYREADVQLLMDSVYGDSAFYLPPGSPVLRGQDQFRGQFSFLEPFGAEGVPGPDITFDIVDRDFAGDLAYDIGTYTIRSPNAPDEADVSRGKFIVIWKRGTDGRWRIHADAFSGME